MISRKAEYAIATLVELAQAAPGKALTSAGLARNRAIPATLIAQIVAAMAKVGWVATRRGAGGGVSLAAEPATLTLRQVIELIDGPVGITRCLIDEKACASRNSCALRGVWAQAQARMLEVLEGVTIAALSQAIEPAAGEE